MFTSPFLQEDARTILLAQAEAVNSIRGWFNVVTEEDVPVKPKSFANAPRLCQADLDTILRAANTAKETWNRGLFLLRNQPYTF